MDRPLPPVILLQMGGPATVRDLEPFLFELFRDPDIIQLGRFSRFQVPLARFVARRRAPRMARRYAAIGGGSPIRRHTNAQAIALAAELKRRGTAAPVDFVFRYAAPRAPEVLERVLPVPEVAALSLYPHWSRTTTGSSLRDLDRSLRATSPTTRIRAVDRWGAHPSYVALLRSQLADALAKMEERSREPVHVLFSAHGIPQSYHDRGDPYRAEVEETFRLVTDGLEGYAGAHLGFQSKVGPVAWLRPYTDEILAKLGRQGVKCLVTVPFGFVSDHIETLYDLDITYREAAWKAGITEYYRVAAFNDDPRFAGVLADVLLDAGRNGGWA